MSQPRIIRITTVPLSLNVLLRGQMRYMKEHGMDVIMVSADGRELATVLANEQCPHIIVPMTRKMTPLRDLTALFKLIRLFKQLKPDIVHSHTPKAGLLAMLAASLAGVKIRIHTIAGLRFMTAKGMTRRILVTMEKLTGRVATHVWPNSFSLQQFIIRNKLVAPKKLEVIGRGSSNGIDLLRYSSSSLDPSKIENIKEQIKYDPRFIYLLCVGRIVKDKGIDELVIAFAQVYEKNSSLRLLMVGDFEDELDPVSEMARKVLKTHPGVIMAGWSDEVEYFMHLSHLLIHPSYREGFPNVLLQAGAMDCPIICSAIPGNVDIVTHHETGLLFEVGNAEKLEKEIEWAVSHPDVMKQYAAQLKNKIKDYYDQKVVHQLLYKRYLELIHN